MKKNIIYILIAVVGGLALGYVLFGSSSKTSENAVSAEDQNHDHSGETAAEMWTCSMHPQIMQSEPSKLKCVQPEVCSQNSEHWLRDIECNFPVPGRQDEPQQHFVSTETNS